MKLRTIIDSPCGLRYCVDNLSIQSSYSRRYLLDSDMLLDKEHIEEEYALVRAYYELYMSHKEIVEQLQFSLKSLRDINGTLNRLFSGAVLDDIELFEIKHLALLSNKIKSGGLESVIGLLDPDGLRMETFYIYNSYSSELSQLRAKIDCMEDGQDKLKMKEDALNIELEIRTKISSQLQPYAQELILSLNELARMDIAVAKAIQIDKLSLCFPEFSSTSTNTFDGLFNPLVQSVLIEKGFSFQKIDIKYGDKPTLIIGANMGGKTVVLKSLTLSQYLFQFGFGVPAAAAQMNIYDSIFLVIGDGQNENKGLSSFSSEMLSINKVLQEARNTNNIVAFIDEPARSTNPIEGTALVSSLISILSGLLNSVVMTTHYTIENEEVKRLKVKGLINGKMDYTIEETQYGIVPNEALNVAETLGIDKHWIDDARNFLNTNLKKY